MTPLLNARNLRRSYPSRGLPNTGRIVAVDGVDFELARSQAIAIVGQSGSGKSTLARLLLALEQPDEGTVEFDGMNITRMSQGKLRPHRRRFQAVFQDPTSSLNPHLRISSIINEPLIAHSLGSKASRRVRIEELLDAVGLSPSSADRYPEAFSAGERQRIAIARALATEPELLILDEPVSALDVTIRVQIVRLIDELRRSLDLSIIFISHDLEVVKRVCEHTMVMYKGMIVESGRTEDVLTSPKENYTRQLIAAAPQIQLHKHAATISS